MGFKADTSFLKFLTMGAIGAQRVVQELQDFGFQPIELERYCTANKIWATKVKRLRMPDLLCVRTGLRIEVRSKSTLALKMSDAPNNPDRAWDAGLRDNDVIAFVSVQDEHGRLVPGMGQYFMVDVFRETAHQSRVGPPKSASEGAERDRTWRATVPSRPGTVVAVSKNSIVVEFGGDGRPSRRQTFNIAGKHPYVTPGEQVRAGEQFLAGAPSSQADLAAYVRLRYEPVTDLRSKIPVDRYAATKAIRPWTHNVAVVA